jgi:hypothetical protein
MKKVNLLLAASVIALGSVFTSCSDTENAVPEITFAAASGTINGETLTLAAGSTSAVVTYTVAAEAEIKELKIGFGTALSVVTEAAGEATYTKTVTLSATSGSFTVKVTDKDGNELTKTIGVASNPLAAATTFTLTYKSNTQDDKANENALTGIKYAGNSSASPYTANINIISDAKNMVVLADKAAYDAITTKEALVAAYTAGTAVSTFAAATETAFVKRYFITKTNDVYYLISLDSIALAPGNNVATLSYKK